MNDVRPRYPSDEGFYADLARRRDSFTMRGTHEVPAGTGYGFHVRAGQTFRFVTVDGPQIIDVDIFNADDPTEHFASGAQFNIEGGIVTRFTRIWGTPPRSRPLSTVIGDTVATRDNPAGLRDHKCYGAHCNAHHWLLFAGSHPRTCYDNLRAGCAMLGLSQRSVHDNLNIFQKSAMDPYTGRHLTERSDAEPGDLIEFYAEIDLMVAISLCPYGDGAIPPHGWRDAQIPVHPMRIEISDTGVKPLGWPYR